MQVPLFSREALLSKEEGLIGKKSDPRPVVPEQVHPMRQVQNNNHNASVDLLPPGGSLVLFTCLTLLACPSSTDFLKLPGLLPWEKVILVQGNALRS